MSDAGGTSDEPATGDVAHERPASPFPVRRIVRAPRVERPAREVSRDETDLGWGDAPGERDDDWYRRERPPHHG